MFFKGLLCRDVNEVALDTQLKTVSLQLLLCQQSTTTAKNTQQPISGSARGGVGDSWQVTGADSDSQSTCCQQFSAEPL